MKILLVEDNAVTGEALAELLRGRGHEVTWTGNGLGALTQLEAPGGIPNVIVLDLLMPGMDGVELVRHLRRHPQLACVPIIAITAAAEAQVERFDEQLETCKPCRGAVLDCPLRPIKLLRKPFEITELEAALHEATQRTTDAPGG